MKTGDSNFRFFHLTTIHRRQRNKVLKLKKNDCAWLEKEENIRDEFEGYFKDLFSGIGLRDWEEGLGALKPIISDDINRKLMQPISIEEVKEATFQMGAHKAPGPYSFHDIFYHSFGQQ